MLGKYWTAARPTNKPAACLSHESGVSGDVFAELS